MRWVPHLRINTRVRVLGRRTEQHARGPVKNRRPLFTVQNWAADLKKLARLCRRAAQYTAAHTVFAETGRHCLLYRRGPVAGRQRPTGEKGLGGTHS